VEPTGGTIMQIFLVVDGHGYGNAIKAFHSEVEAEKYIQSILTPTEKSADEKGFSSGYTVNEIELIE
jgi:hypothetical protein